MWNQQLEVPVKWPTMLDTITVSVWDHDHINTDDAIDAMEFSYRSAAPLLGPPPAPLPLPSPFPLPRFPPPH